MHLLDTNIWIYAYKDIGGCRQRLQALADTDVHISSVTIMELSYGLAKSNRPAPMRLFLSAICQRYKVVDFCARCAEQAGPLRAQLSARGTPIGPFDLQLAATALANQLTMVTRNASEFSRVPLLRVENWFDDAVAQGRF